MTLQHASLALVCACLHFATLIAATEPLPLHEARQGPISILFPGPGLVSIRTTSSSSSTTTTMSPTSSSKSSSFSSSAVSPARSSTLATTSSHTPSLAFSSSGTPASASPSTGTSATPQPSSSPANLTFTVHNMTTCTSALISWNYSGKEADLLLSITNIGVPHNDDLLLNDTIQQQLVDTNSSAPSFVWPSVNVSQGWYEIQGLVLSNPAVSGNSAPFFVLNGTDVSCFTGTSSQVSPTGASSAIVASKTNVGGIVGGVVGGVIGVTLVAIAALLLWSRRRRRPFVVRGGRKDGAWGSLKSTSSSIHPATCGVQLTNNHFHSHSDSVVTTLQDVMVGKVSATTTPGGSDEDAIVTNQEKLVSPAPSTAMSPFDALNTPIHYDRRASTYSVQTPTAVASDPFRSRVPSNPASGQSLEQQAQRIRSSMETSMRRRSDRLSMPNLPPTSIPRAIPQLPAQTQSNEEHPLAPVTPTPVSRSISTGAVSTSIRRTSRKPVPHYDSSLLEDQNADTVSTFTAGAESSHSHGTGLGTGTHGTPSDLTHMASFGDGRPVHYLIPDMPLAQED